MLTAVITGANSGIGHEWAKLLVKEGYTVHALDISRAGPISALAGPTCTTHAVDLTDAEAVTSFAASLAHAPVHLLVHVAGVLPGADTLETATPASMARTFQVNAAAPLHLTQALLPNLLSAAAEPAAEPVRVVAVSSRMGSLGDNRSGGSYAYRASKAALNAVARSLAADLRGEGVVVALLHPGIVRTNLVPITDPAEWERAAEPEVAAEGLWKTLNERFKGLDDSGRFFHREGWEIPW